MSSVTGRISLKSLDSNNWKLEPGFLHAFRFETVG